MHPLEHHMPPARGHPLAVLVGHAVAADVADLVQVFEEVELVEHFEGAWVEGCGAAVHGLVFSDVLFCFLSPCAL